MKLILCEEQLLEALYNCWSVERGGDYWQLGCLNENKFQSFQ